MEFHQPSDVSIHGDTMMVFDLGNGRLQVWTVAGEYVRSIPLPDGPPGGFWAVGPDGHIASPTLGRYGVLTAVTDTQGRRVGSLGVSVGKDSRSINPRQMKEDLARGQVPDLYMNYARPVFGRNGVVWLVMPARGSVEGWTLSGQRLDSVGVAWPERADVQAEIQERNRGDGRAMTVPFLILDADVVGTELWVLVNTGERGPARVVILEPGREGVRHLTWPVVGAEGFAVDAARGWVYFLVGGRAGLVRVPMVREDRESAIGVYDGGSDLP